jgi:hypothetical protein
MVGSKKYDIMKTLGTGASCKVKLGIERESKARAAVKMFKKGHSQDKMAEVFAFQTIPKHENVVEVLE